jgi:hypothetical protein
LSRWPLLFNLPTPHLYVMENNKQLQEELTYALTDIYRKFISTLQKFDDKQINEIPFEGSWTPGRVADHIIKATGGIPDRDTTPADRPYNEKVAQMESVFLDFEAKYTSPSFVVPGSGPFEKKLLIASLHSLLERHLQKVNDTDLTALCLKFELPGVGTMTRYEWFRFIVAHMKRHQFQLENILTNHIIDTGIKSQPRHTAGA